MGSVSLGEGALMLPSTMVSIQILLPPPHSCCFFHATGPYILLDPLGAFLPVEIAAVKEEWTGICGR